MRIFAAAALLVAICASGCVSRPPASSPPIGQPVVRWTSGKSTVALPLAVVTEDDAPTDLAVFLPFLGTEELFVIDTGASRTWISPELCLIKGLVATEDVIVQGLGSSKTVFKRTAATRVDLGFAVIEHWPLMVGKIPMIERRNSHWEREGLPVVRGLLGADLLHALGATIDYRERQIRFQRPGQGDRKPRPDTQNARLPRRKPGV